MAGRMLLLAKRKHHVVKQAQMNQVESLNLVILGYLLALCIFIAMHIV